MAERYATYPPAHEDYALYGARVSLPGLTTPREPSEGELAACEQRLQDAARRDRKTVPARGKGKRHG